MINAQNGGLNRLFGPWSYWHDLEDRVTRTELCFLFESGNVRHGKCGERSRSNVKYADVVELDLVVVIHGDVNTRINIRNVGSLLEKGISIRGK